MENINWKEILVDYPNGEEIFQVYEEWGKTPYLKELFDVLSEYNEDWNKEKELGSWAADFILDILEETEGEIGEGEEETWRNALKEMVAERYEDFRNGRQFVRINNAALQSEGESYDRIRQQAIEEGEKIGFPILL